MQNSPISIEKDEKERLAEILKIGEKALFADQKNEYKSAIAQYKEAAAKLEIEVKKAPLSKRAFFQIPLETYNDRIICLTKLMELSPQKNEKTPYLHNDTKFNSPILSRAFEDVEQAERRLSLTEERKKKLAEIEDEKINFFSNFTSGAPGETIEHSLNEMNEERKLDLVLKVFEESIYYGGRISKSLYMPSTLWRMILNNKEQNEILEKNYDLYEKIFEDCKSPLAKRKTLKPEQIIPEISVIAKEILA